MSDHKFIDPDVVGCELTSTENFSPLLPEPAMQLHICSAFYPEDPALLYLTKGDIKYLASQMGLDVTEKEPQ